MLPVCQVIRGPCFSAKMPYLNKKPVKRTTPPVCLPVILAGIKAFNLAGRFIVGKAAGLLFTGKG